MITKALPILLSIIAVCSCNSLDGSVDVKRLQKILQDNIKSKDVGSLYYAARGLKLLNAQIPNVCEDISKLEVKTVEQAFYLSNAAALTNCVKNVKPAAAELATKTIEKKDASLSELYYAVYTLKALGKPSAYDKEDNLKNLVQLLKKDDSAANYAYVFMLCEHMGCGHWTISHAESLLLSADEVDSKALQFEGGLPVTSNILTSISRTYKSNKKPLPLNADQKLKFSRYLLSRRSVNTPKGATLLLDAAQAIADDETTPIVITVKGKKHITFESDSIEIAITDLLGRQYKGLKADDVVAQSATRLIDDVVVLSKQPLTQKANEQNIYVLNLNKIKSQYGVYKVAISAAGKTSNVNIAVLGDISVSNIEIGVSDSDGTTSPKITTLEYPNKLAQTIKVDQMQKVTMKFTVKDKANKAVTVQQAFIHIGSGSSEETIFVAEPDSSKAYKVDLNVNSLSKFLKDPSGSYIVSVFIGDNAVSKPILWTLGEFTFNFGKAPAAQPKTSTSSPQPEIRHQFRLPEPRPSRFVSDAFALLSALPLLLLLAVWGALRVNFRGMPFSIHVLTFHGCIGCFLALYGMLWLKLTMFETVRYLLPLALVTFISGHRLLRRLVSDKHK